MPAPHPALLPLLRGDTLPPDTAITSQVVASAEEHGVAALVDAEIQRRGIEINPDVATRLASSTLEATEAYDTALHAAARVQEAAAGIGVDIAFFGSLTTAARWYQEPQTCPAVDVKIFVSPTQLDRMGDLTVTLGDDSPDAQVMDTMAGSGRVFEHSIPVDGTSVDLYRDPMNMALPTVHAQAMWEDTVKVSLTNGLEVRALSLEWAIVRALLDALTGNFADLVDVHDLGVLFDQDPDWGRIADIAADEGWTDIIRYATAFACDTLGRPTSLPRQIARWRLKLIESVWPRDGVLQGADSAAPSMRQQSALGLLAKGRTPELIRSYVKRVAPPREIIDLRAGPTDDSYLVALYRWRLSQSRSEEQTEANVDTAEDG